MRNMPKFTKTHALPSEFLKFRWHISRCPKIGQFDLKNSDGKACKLMNLPILGNLSRQNDDV